MPQDLQGFAYSFSHAIVRVNEKQFSDISAVSINQDLTEGAVYGTDARPLKRSVGQLSMGKGQLTFSDMGEAVDFYTALGAQPMMTIWTLSYQLVKPDGDVRSIDCASCRINSIGIQHQAGAEALGMTFPFSFMSVRINGVDSFLSPQGIFNLVQNGVNAIANLL
jgi:hypothetical protein